MFAIIGIRSTNHCAFLPLIKFHDKDGFISFVYVSTELKVLGLIKAAMMSDGPSLSWYLYS